MATAFNDKYLKTGVSQSRISQNNHSAHSNRSRSNMMRTKLSQNEKMSYNQSFNEYDRRSKRNSRDGNLSLQEDQSFNQPGDRFVGHQGPPVQPSSRRSSVDQERELGAGNLLSTKNSSRGQNPIHIPTSGGHKNSNQALPDDLSHSQLGHSPDQNSNLANKNAPKVADLMAGDDPKSRGTHNPAPKDQTKFTSHDWPQNKEYIDIAKLKTEHIQTSVPN
jgi:hypothetical protein